LRKIIIFIDKITLYTSIFLITSLFVVILLKIFLRQVFGISYVMFEGLSTIAFACCSCFTITYAFSKKAHVSVNYLFNKLNVTSQRFLHILIFLIILFFLIFLMRYSWFLAMRQMLIPIPFSPFPRGYMFISLPINCFLMCIISLNEIYEVLLKKRKIIQKY